MTVPGMPLLVDSGGARLAASLHPAPGSTGIVMVSGGVQTRFGAHRGFYRWAAQLAARGYPVLRFDRQGVGDSDGLDRGFRTAAADIAAAVAALRAAQPQLTAVMGLGLCDGAAALLLAGDAAQAGAAPFDGLMLLNPWTPESEDPARAEAHHYRRRLRNRRAALRRLLSGGIGWRAVVAQLSARLKARQQGADWQAETRELVALLAGWKAHALVVTSGEDFTGQMFRAAWTALKPRRVHGPGFVDLAGCDHTFSTPGGGDALVAALLDWLARTRA